MKQKDWALCQNKCLGKMKNATRDPKKEKREEYINHGEGVDLPKGRGVLLREGSTMVGIRARSAESLLGMSMDTVDTGWLCG